MCSRYNLKSNLNRIFEAYSIGGSPSFEWLPRYDIRPTHSVIAIRQQADGIRSVGRVRWGLIPSWATSHTEANINARSETVDRKPSFREAIRKRRCIIPADGFYEFESTSAHTRQKWHIFRNDTSLLHFAGIWETWKDDQGQPVETCAIVTTEANRWMSEFHDRMPVILEPGSFSQWLDPKTTDPRSLVSLYAPCPEDWLQRDPVANTRDDSPKCIQPVQRQRGLFD